MPQLAHANLKVHIDDYSDSVEVSINAASKLRWLKLTVSSLNGAGDIKLQLSVLQPLLSYYVDCGGIIVKHNFGRLVPSPHAPLLFKMDSTLIYVATAYVQCFHCCKTLVNVWQTCLLPVKGCHIIV